MSCEKTKRRVAANIKELRKKRGFLQRDFASIGFKLRHYQKIESGQANVTLKTLDKLSKALNVEVDELFLDKAVSLQLYKRIFLDCPFGIILWQLKDLKDPHSLCLYDYNQFGEKAVHRSFAKARGKLMSEIFPLAEGQGMLEIFFTVITTGKTKFIPHLIRYDHDFPLTVFSTKFIKCDHNIAAAIFTDVTKEFLANEQVHRQKMTLEQLQKLPTPESEQVANLKNQVNTLLARLNLPPQYVGKS